jgi:hypothetical protein
VPAAEPLGDDRRAAALPAVARRDEADDGAVARLTRHAGLLHHADGAGVRRIGLADDALEVERRERVREHGAHRFGREPVSPAVGRDPVDQLDLAAGGGAQAAEAHECLGVARDQDPETVCDLRERGDPAATVAAARSRETPRVPEVAAHVRIRPQRVQGR